MINVINVAIVENDVVINVGVFDEDSYEQVKAEWADLMPHWELIPIDQLPEGCWIGWQRDAEGVWSDPNAFVEEPEGEAP